MGTRRVRALGLALLVLVASAGCTVKNVDEAHVGIGYTTGMFEGEHFDGVIPPGGSRTVVNDEVHKLPTRQVTWIMSNAEGADAPAVTVTADNGELMVMDLTVRGFLNTRESTVKQFFLEICQKDRRAEGGTIIPGCWEDAGDHGPAGWILMLQDAFGDPAIAVANDVGLDYDAEQLRYNTETKREFAADFATAFRQQQTRMVGNSSYFCGPGYDRSETDREAEDWCPDLAVQVTGIHYEDPELEGIRSQQELAEQQEELAVQQAETARAQQAAQNARSTPQNLALMERQAMLDCVSKDRPEGAGPCNLTIIVNGSGQPLNATVPAG